MSRYMRQSKKAHTSPSRDAWWYANPKSIDIFVAEKKGAPAIHCRIMRRDLLRYIKQTEPKR